MNHFLFPDQVKTMDAILKSTDLKRFIVVSMLMFWCVSMIAVRIQRTGSGYYAFLIFNLILAGVPLFFSTVLRFANHWELPWQFQLPLFVLCYCFCQTHLTF